MMNVTKAREGKTVKFLCSSSALVQRFFSFLFLRFRVLGEELSLALLQHYKIRKGGLFLHE